MTRMRGTANHDEAWSVILAGGEGERVRPLVEDWLGYHKPKQYCAFVGCRSLFQHTVDRADGMSSPNRRVTVVAETHRHEVATQLRGRSVGTVVHQPRNRGTAAGVFLGLTYVRARDPDALVTIFPSDHFVHPEARFAEAVAEARRMARRARGRLVLLGVQPEGPEAEYGWIETGDARESAGPFRASDVLGFVEKPTPAEAGSAFSRGALWNALIVTGRLETFWRIGWRLLPEMMGSFEALESAIGTPEEDKRLRAVYRSMPVRDFSADVLQKCPEALIVLELSGVTWSDWGRPERIRETLRAIGKKPAFEEKDDDRDRRRPDKLDTALLYST